jgi:hypothetical protein
MKRWGIWRRLLRRLLRQGNKCVLTVFTLCFCQAPKECKVKSKIYLETSNHCTCPSIHDLCILTLVGVVSS